MFSEGPSDVKCDQKPVSREDIKSDALYINSTDTFSFAPFPMIDEKTAVPLRSNDKVIGKLHLSDIINTLFTFYCSYSEDTAFIKPVGKSLTDSVMID